MKGVLAIGFLGGLLYLGSKLWRAKKIGDKSIVRTQKPRISRISLAGLTVATDLYVDNPTNGTVRVSKPVVTFSSGGNYIASSVPSQDMFSIDPLSQSSLGTTEVEIPWTALTPYISGLLSRIPAIASKTNTSLQSLNIPLEYSYSLYVNDLYKSTSSLASLPEASPSAIRPPVEVPHIISKQSPDFFPDFSSKRFRIEAL